MKDAETERIAKINGNIRCFEIEVKLCVFKLIGVINGNIRCFEI